MGNDGEVTVRSAEPVGVWRTYQTGQDVLATQELPADPVSGGATAGVFISAAMIVRNEERHVRSCLESLRNIVDEVVVVDTGSTDSTIEIAREFGASVSEFPWTDDFSAPRNESFRRARGDWILTIDADERLRPYSGILLRKQLSDPATGACYVLVQRRKRMTPNRQMKLYRNHPGLRHCGLIHEGITPEQVRSVTGLRLGVVPLIVEHRGYDGDLTTKHRRNLPLLVRQLERDPDAPELSHVWGHLADLREAIGQTGEAVAASERAVELLRQKEDLHPADCAGYLRVLTRQVDAGQLSERLLEEGTRLFPGNPQLNWIRGHWLMGRELVPEAVKEFEHLLARGRAGEFDQWVGYDRRLFGGLSYRSLAECHARLGNRAEECRYRAMASAEMSKQTSDRFVSA